MITDESREQEKVVKWCGIRNIPIAHIPNEGKRSVSYGAKLKRMGIKKGFPDLIIPLVRGKYHGLFIEMKYGNGKTSPEQDKWLNLLASEGYACAVCNGSHEAINLIEYYYKLK